MTGKFHGTSKDQLNIRAEDPANEDFPAFMYGLRQNMDGYVKRALKKVSMKSRTISDRVREFRAYAYTCR